MTDTPLKVRQKLIEQRKFKMSCIVPSYNEGENISMFLTTLYPELKKFTDFIEIIVVDDGSTDSTQGHIANLLETIPIKLVSLSRNFGKEQALAAGLAHATGNATLIIDADFQHPFSLIETFLQKWYEGYDMIYGVRQNREHDSLLKRAFTKVFYKLLSYGSNVTIPKNAGDFRLIDRQGVIAINNCPERNRFTKGIYAWIGFKSIGVPFEVAARKHGSSAWSFRRLGELALTGLFSFTNTPLRIWTLIGLLISGLAFCFGSYIIFETLFYGRETPGYATLAVSIMFFGGIQLFSIGILGEYIALIFTEVKGRPAYFVSHVVESPCLPKK